MSNKDADAPIASQAPANHSKLVVILAGGAFVLSLVTAAMAFVLLSRPVADKIEQGNTEIKEAIDANGASLAKKIVALQDACIDWQAVLKTVSDKPDATFRIVKTADGMLTLSEVEQMAPSDPVTQTQKN